MSVVYVKETWDGREGSDGLDRRREYTRTFEVRTSTSSDDATVAGGPQARALGLPGNGYAYPLDNRAVVTKIRAQQHTDDYTLWTVTIEYSTSIEGVQARGSQTFDPVTGVSRPSTSGQINPTTGQVGQIAENPLDRDPEYSVEYEETVEPLTHTWRNVPILNCANDPYEGLEDEVLRQTIVVTKNYPSVDLVWLDNFADAVNNTKWLNRMPRTCRITGISTSPAIENGVSFIKGTFRVKYKRETWDRRLMERGFRAYQSMGVLGLRKATIRDEYGVPVAAAVPLDGVYSPVTELRDFDMPPALQTEVIEGVRYAPTGYDGTTGQGKILPSGTIPKYTRWRVKPEKNFALLGI